MLCGALVYLLLLTWCWRRRSYIVDRCGFLPFPRLIALPFITVYENCNLSTYIYNARSPPMSSLFLTVLSPTLLCARLLVLIFRSTARCHTHVSELSA